MERCTSRTDLTEAALKTVSQVQQESVLTFYRTMTTLGTTDNSENMVGKGENAG